MNMSFDLNQMIGILAIAVFVLPLTYLIGYARYEKQHRGWANNARKGFEAERKSLLATYEAKLGEERNVIRELEISLLKAGEALETEANKAKDFETRWKISNPYRLVIVQHMIDKGLWDFKSHDSCPTLMLNKLYEHVIAEAFNIETSKAAKNLHTRGVRKGAKMGREQMRKLMQKSIDNQSQVIWNYVQEIAKANTRRRQFDAAVTNVLNDKIALVSVRRAIKLAIIVEHDRLRAVAAEQGE